MNYDNLWWFYKHTINYDNLWWMFSHNYKTIIIDWMFSHKPKHNLWWCHGDVLLSYPKVKTPFLFRFWKLSSTGDENHHDYPKLQCFIILWIVITALYNLIFGHTQFLLSKSYIPNVFFERNLPIHCSHGTVTPRASSTNATLWSGVAPGRVLTQSNPPVFPKKNAEICGVQFGIS